MADFLQAADISGRLEAAEQAASLREAMLRVYNNPIKDLRREIGQFAQPSQALKECLSQFEEYNRCFSLPLQNQLNDLSKSLSHLSSVDILGLSATRIAELEKSILGLKQPWLDMESKLQSTSAVSELHTIAVGLLDHPSFSRTLTTVLRKDLGDWRSIAQLPDSIFTDPIERFDFYTETGFDDTLTDFPQPVFEEILDRSGLRFFPLPKPAEQFRRGLVLEPDDTDENISDLNLEAYALIYRVETNLRRFIDEQMTTHFGQNWPKNKTPAGMHQEWEDKAKRAQAAGESIQPLIAYADFSDYISIIGRNDNWNQVFRPIFRRKTDIQESMNRLGPVRVCTMHARIITKEDYLLLLAESHRIFKAIGISF